MEPFVRSKWQKFLDFLEWEEFKGEVKWLIGAGKRKKVTATKGTETKKRPGEAGSQRYILGEIIEIRGKKYKIDHFREEDGEPMMVPVE